MLTFYISLLPLVVLALPGVFTPSVGKSMQNHSGFKLDFTVSYGTPGSSQKDSAMTKRADESVTLPLFNKKYYYSTRLAVGSNEDICEVLVDTGSADTWVVDSNVVCTIPTEDTDKSKRDIPEDESKDVSRRYKKRRGSRKGKKLKKIIPSYRTTPLVNECKESGVFNKDKSSTFELFKVDPEFKMSYVDKTEARGVWGTDIVQTSQVRVRMPIGVANESSDFKGVLGLGHPDDTFMKKRKGKTYSSFPFELKKAGYITKMAYSLYLNDKYARKGSVLFGAVDHKKYYGKLQTVKMINTYRYAKVKDFNIVLDKMFLQDNRQTVTIFEEPIGATLDSGTTNQAFPKNIFFALVKSMSGSYYARLNRYRVDCSYREHVGYVGYEFSGIRIKIPMSELVRRYKDICYLAAMVRDEKYFFPSAYLGDSFLRNVYVVYDLENMEISMAPVKYTDEEEVEAIISNVPRAVQASGYSNISTVTHVRTRSAPRFRSW